MIKKSKNAAQQKNPSSTRARKVVVAKAAKLDRARYTPAAHLSESPHPLRGGTKLATMITMLQRPDGVSIEALAKATGWQVHSVRGALSGTLKKKLGLAVASNKTGKIRLYRIDGNAAA